MEPSSNGVPTACTDCKPLNTPGMRSSNVEVEGKNIRYLRQFWACSECGREWEDADLSHRNELAREEARTRTRLRGVRLV
ncbi:MAG TPA: hypothetical protein VGL13_02650 [Polyangiaceae bacterium]|jgi:transposase-like protein